MSMRTVRQPAVAGRFYPGRAEDLARTVDRLLADARDAARSPVPASGSRLRALLVPHAGYVYSGPTAARGYALLDDSTTRVVLIGPAHQVGFRGLALPQAEAFATPLGEIPVDAEAADRLAVLPGVVRSDHPHAGEHSLEVQLPFLQRVLGAWTLVPLVVGDATPEEVATVLEAAWGGDRTLVVASSDLSHYLPYAEARRVDADTVGRILALEWPLGDHAACGARPLNGLLALAAAHGLRADLLDHRNSGDMVADRSRVVGYASVRFTEPDGGGSHDQH